MTIYSDDIISGMRRSVYRALLALSFLLGLCAGMISFLLTGCSFAPTVCGSLLLPASTVTVLMLFCMPYLLSVVASFFSPGAMLAVCFLKTFLFGFSALAIYRNLFDFGYFSLVCLWFGDLVSLPLLYFWWLRSWFCGTGFSVSTAAAFIAVAFLIGTIYIRFLPPVLGM